MNALDAIRKRKAELAAIAQAQAAELAVALASSAPAERTCCNSFRRGLTAECEQPQACPHVRDWSSYTGVEVVYSGGQTGADAGILAAGMTLGLKTGGWVPRGWRTDEGAAPWLAELGLKEHSSDRYPPRTFQNVRDTDGTLVFGDRFSSGSKLTIDYCRDAGKPTFCQDWRSGLVWTDEEKEQNAEDFRKWLKHRRIRVLNGAGNRERKQPGIYTAMHDFVVAALRGWTP